MELLQSFDNNILLFIHNNLLNPIADFLLPIITKLGSDGAIWILLSLILISMKKYRKYGFMILLSLVIYLIVGSKIIKPLVARPRPFMELDFIKLIVDKPSGYSFPSGHSMSAFSAATILMFMNKKIGITGIILASIIAFSRVYLFVHYPSDVIAGAVLGVIAGILSYKLVNYLYKTKVKSAV